MNTAASVGIGMAVTGLVLVVLALLLTVPRLMRLTKRLEELNDLLEDNLRLTQDELQILHRARSETRVLLGPFRKLGRWLGHPLTIALFASYRRRLAIRRRASPGT